MSSSSNLDKNDMQPPPKRQRILPQGSFASPGSAQSRPMPSLCHRKTASVSSPSLDSGLQFTDVQEIDGFSSIESALGVPTRILFRRVGGDRKEGESTSDGKHSSNKKISRRRLRPLLSRQEAEQFLRLTLLAQEIDALVDLSETVLSRRQFARRFRRQVLMQRDANDKDRPWKNPWLATLGPILDVLEKRQSNPSIENQYASDQQPNPQGDTLHYINHELTRLYHALQACGVYELERAAEQNRSLAASLTDILGYTLDNDDDNDNGRTSAVRNLAREKRSLSKLQDLLAKRVRSLLIVLCHSRSTWSAKSNHASDNEAKMGDDRIDRKQILFDEQLSSPSVDGNTERIAGNKNNKVGYDDESSILWLEEILVPLEVVCDELFDKADPKVTASTTAARIHNENDNVSDHCADDLEDNQIYLEASQRTVGAATTILSLSGNTKEDIDSHDQGTAQPSVGEEASDRDTMTTSEPLLSQSAVGAAATMMELSTKMAERDDVTKSQSNGDNKAGTGNGTNRNHPHTQQNPGNDDGSFIDDPPSDGEDEYVETTIEEEATPSKNAKNSVGIFDVVDVLTPQSQSLKNE